MAYGDFKDSRRRAIADKMLDDKAFYIAKYDRYHRRHASMVYNFVYKKTTLLAQSENLSTWGKSASNTNRGTGINSGIVFENKELAKALHKPIIKIFEKQKVHSPFIDNIWGAELADMQLLSKFSKGIWFLLCVIDIFSKYAGLFL